MSEQALGHSVGALAFALNVWGNLALTKTNANGWWIRIAANAAWLAYSIWLGWDAWALAANHVVFAYINVLGIMRWRQPDPHPTRRTR